MLRSQIDRSHGRDYGPLDSPSRLHYYPSRPLAITEPTVGIYDRDYYRDDPPQGSWGIDGLTPGVKYLIVANVVIFLLQIFTVHDERMQPAEVMRNMDPVIEKMLADKE